jgi:SNF2 family DNA or RNA helicase
MADAWAHQAREFDEHRDDKARALLWTMRTGKSKAVIDKAEYQFAKGNIEGVIVLAPNGIHINWVLNEIPKWSWPFNEARAFAWETPKRADWDRIAAFNSLCEYRDGIRYLTVNMEALQHPDGQKAIQRFRRSCSNKVMLVISEAHHFGRAGAKRTQIARNIARSAKFITVETGTAILNSPLRAYSIYKIMDDLALGPEFAGKAYEKFVKQYANIVETRPKASGSLAAPAFRTQRAFKKIEGYKNLDELRDKMAPWSSVVTREDVVGMPPLLRVDRLVVMSEKQRRAYLEMVSRHLVEIETETVTAADAGARVQKLQQILNGYVKDGDDIIDIDPDAPIYDALVEEVLGTYPENSIVWCRYREDIVRVCRRLKLEGIKFLEFHGGVPTGKREAIRLQFQNSTRPIVLVGQPGAGGEGRDFSRAHAVIFFSSTPNAIHVNQAEERGTEKWGHPVTIVRIRTPGTVDDRNWQIVDGKTDVADDLSGRGLRDLLMRTDV